MYCQWMPKMYYYVNSDICLRHPTVRNDQHYGMSNPPYANCLTNGISIICSCVYSRWCANSFYVAS